jgi:hypothetical protein
MVAVLLGILIAGVFIYLSHSASCDTLQCIRFHNKSVWKEQEIYEQTNTSYRALYRHGNDFLRLEKSNHMAPQDAALLTKVDVMKTMGLFDDARSPYPGAISDTIKCDKAFVPKVDHVLVGDLSVTYFSGWVNNRLQYGTCLDGELPYRSYSAYFYCPNQKSFYHMEIIWPKSDHDDSTGKDFINSLKCL